MPEWATLFRVSHELLTWGQNTALMIFCGTAVSVFCPSKNNRERCAQTQVKLSSVQLYAAKETFCKQQGTKQ